MIIPVSQVQDGRPETSESLINQLDKEDKRAINDLLFIANNKKMYINEKGYLQKLVDLLYNLGYYSFNESIFLTRED